MSRLVPLSIVLVAAAACSQPPTSPTYTVPLTASAVSAGSPLSATHLRGHEEVPARDTNAQGQAIMKVSADGLSISYKLIVANIDNVVASHIHIGAVGQNGPIAVFLAGPFTPGGGPVDGILAEGTFTAANFIGPLANQPMSALIAQLEAGNAYVNVHTNDGQGSPNSGPGDFPGGEIRGQIKKK